MYEVIDGHTLMTVNDWLRCGLTMGQFWQDSSRGLLDIYRRSTGGNTLIDVLSIRRPERRRKIELEMGKLPKDGLSKVPSIFTVVADTDAISYYSEYTDERGLRLSDDTQHLYANGAAVLNTLIAARRQMIESNLKIGKKINMAKMYESFSRFAEEQTEFRNALPRNARRLREKMEEYGNGGGRDYGCLVKRNAVSGGTSGAAKISEKAGQWLVARFATPINKVTMEQLYEEYNAIAPVRRWKTVETVDTIRNYMNKPEIKPLWYGMRYGELKSKEKYARQHRTLLPEVRDALWYGDGTKLNYFYLNDKGEVATINVYEVVDVYSEALIGYHISESEDYEAQYYAYRMAMEMSGCKPYEIRFDNQGGHKKLDSSNFFAKLTRHAIPTQPYNGKSKTIESIFGRFQSEFLHREWYFTGQNVTATKKESRVNMEFILANKGNLPTLDEVKRVYAQRRADWNNAPHPDTGRPRIEMYRTSENPNAQKLNVFDRLGIFGVMTQKPSKYRANGIEIQVKGQKYAFEVLDAHQLPDMEFIRNNTDREFYVEYIPDDMSFCGLYTKNTKGEFVLVTAASSNRIAKKSILTMITERPGVHHTVVNILDRNGKPTWSENYTPDEVAEMRSMMGERNFQKEYMNNPMTEGAVFRPEQIAYGKILPLKDYKMLVCYTDPSFKNSSTADYKATMLVGRTPDGHFHLLKAFAAQTSVSDMIRWHYEVNDFVAGVVPVMYYMESNFMQDLMLDEFTKVGNELGLHIPIRGDVRKKPDKFARIEAMQPLFERGLVLFNEKEKEAPGMIALVDQLLLFERGSRAHDDAPDALESAIWMLSQRTRTSNAKFTVIRRTSRKW